MAKACVWLRGSVFLFRMCENVFVLLLEFFRNVSSCGSSAPFFFGWFIAIVLLILFLWKDYAMAAMMMMMITIGCYLFYWFFGATGNIKRDERPRWMENWIPGYQEQPHRLLSLWLIVYWLRWTGIFIVEQSIVRWNWIKINWWRQPITHASTCDATSRSSIVVTRSNRKLLYMVRRKLDIRTLFRPISLS